MEMIDDTVDGPEVAALRVHHGPRGNTAGEVAKIGSSGHRGGLKADLCARSR